MRHLGNAIKFVWGKLLSPTSRKIFFLFAWALVILGILALFKYVFLTNCVTIGTFIFPLYSLYYGKTAWYRPLTRKIRVTIVQSIAMSTQRITLFH